MNILIAPDKFKGTLSAWEVCQAIGEGLLRYHRNFNITSIPLADGGEGTLEILDKHLQLQTVVKEVNDPLLRPIKAAYKISGDIAYIEMARASGLELLRAGERNCFYTSSLGTGELILDAYRRGARQFYLFVGGSATCDGGLGVLQALGIKARQQDRELQPIGASLGSITSLDTSALQIKDEISFTVVCDVKNPLYGPQGAAWVFGPQKGASAEEVQQLDAGLQHFAGVIERQQGRKVHLFEGSGAAGGIAAGIAGFFPTAIRAGIDTILEMVKLADAVAAADLVITGEGKLDAQTLHGKVISGVHALCLGQGKKLAVICGTLELTEAQLEALTFWKVLSLTREDTDSATAIKNAYQLLSDRAYELIQP